MSWCYIYRTRECFIPMFNHRGESWKYDVQWSIFDYIQVVWIADETLSQVFDISSQSKQGVNGEVKIYANLYRVSKPPSRLWFLLILLDELLMTLKMWRKRTKTVQCRLIKVVGYKRFIVMSVSFFTEMSQVRIWSELKILQGQGIILLVRENWHFEEKSAKM